MSSDDLFGGEMSYIAYGYRLPHPDSKTHQLLLPPPEPLNAGGPEETGTAGPARIPASLTSLLLSVRSVCRVRELGIEPPGCLFFFFFPLYLTPSLSRP